MSNDEAITWSRGSSPSLSQVEDYIRASYRLDIHTGGRWGHDAILIDRKTGMPVATFHSPTREEALWEAARYVGFTEDGPDHRARLVKELQDEIKRLAEEIERMRPIYERCCPKERSGTVGEAIARQKARLDHR